MASAAVTPAVAKASAGAIEHLPVAVVPNLARYLRDQARRPLDLRRRRRRERRRCGRRTYRRSRVRARREGGAAAARAPALRRADLDSRSRRVESLNVRVAAALLLYEAKRQRYGVGRGTRQRRCFDVDMADPTPVPLRRPQPPARRRLCRQRELRDTLASWVATQGARGVLVFDGAGSGRDARAARGSLRGARRFSDRTPGEREPRAANASASSRATRPFGRPRGASRRRVPRRRSSATSRRRARRAQTHASWRTGSTPRPASARAAPPR